MAMDMFLKLEGIEGEAQDAVHKNEIELLAWSWGMSQSGTTHTGTGGGSGKVAVQDINITKYTDRATSVLMNFCCNGKHISKGTLTIRKAAGDEPIEYLVIDMQEIIVTNISMGGSGGEDRLTENVSLNFMEFHQKYTPQDDTGGKGKVVESKWNMAQNKAV